MRDYQHDFLSFALDCGVLRFGSFTLKSGRQSPYFFNSGLFDSGGRLAALGRFYAAAIVASGIEFDMLYGPAYKGIPLVATTAIALADHHDRDLPYTFNRKEVKDHGEGGALVGAPPKGRVLIIDDVISAGTSARESVELLRSASAEPVAMGIALDRQERGQGSTSAVQEVAGELGLDVVSIANLDTLLQFVSDHPELGQWQESVSDYRARYGAVGPDA